MLLLLPRGESAHAIHLGYYAAAFTLAPPLLIAGVAEMAVLGLFPFISGVLPFVLPAVATGVASLVVLASHNSEIADGVRRPIPRSPSRA